MTNLVLAGASSATITVYRPDGTSIGYNYCYPSGVSCAVNPLSLPVTGTYLVIVQPLAASTGSFGSYLSTDVTGALAPNTAFNLNVARPGQNARLTFSGTAGQGVALEFAGVAATPANWLAGYIYKPDGTVFAVTNVTPPGFTWTTAPLPTTGTYTLMLEPQDSPAGAATFVANVTLESGTPLVVDGPAASGTVATTGESVRFTFSGTAGQNLGLGMTNLVLTGSTSAITTVYKPDGTSLNSFYCYTSNSSCAVNLINLPTTGTYSVVVQPASGATGTFSLYASTDVTGALAPNTVFNLNVARPGQNARLTFAGTAGQGVALEFAGIAATPANSLAGYIYKPDGTFFAVTNVPPPGFTWTTALLPTTGTYTLTLEPQDSPAGAATFVANVTPESGTAITVDGPAVNGTIATTGESARFTFSGTAGQNLGLGMTNLVLTGSTYVIADVYKPDGAWLNYFYCYTSGNTCTLNLANLSATGVYSMVVQPASGATGTFSLDLSSDVTGALAPNTAMNVSLARPGQNARLTFAGTAGQAPALQFAGISTNPAGQALWALVQKPDGTNLGNSYIAPSGTTWTLPVLPVTGIYTVFVEVQTAPQGAATAALTLTLVP